MEIRSEKVLITGISGFVGTALSRELRVGGYHVVGSSRNRLIDESDVKIFSTSSIGRDTDWGLALQGCDVVVHLAARAHILKDPDAEPLESFREINTAGTLNLARQAALEGVRKFIFISSIGVNGDRTGQKAFRYNDEASPHSFYAKSKYEAEKGLLDLSCDCNMDIIIVRVPAVYGYKTPGNIGKLEKLVKSGLPIALGNINNKRSFIAIDNLVSFIKTCIEHPPLEAKIFVISDGVELSTSELLKVLSIIHCKRLRLISVPAFIQKWLLKYFSKNSSVQSLLGDLVVDSSYACSQLSWVPIFDPLESDSK